MRKFNKGTWIKHEDYGRGVIEEFCDDPTKYQVRFKTEPPKPEGYPFSANPIVVSEKSLIKRSV